MRRHDPAVKECTSVTAEIRGLAAIACGHTGALVELASPKLASPWAQRAAGWAQARQTSLMAWLNDDPLDSPV